MRTSRPPSSSRASSLAATASSYVARDDPVVLAQPAGALEAVALEQRDGAIVQEGGGGLAPRRVLGIALHQAAASVCDLVQCAGERGARDAAATMRLVDEEAGDAPVG